MEASTLPTTETVNMVAKLLAGCADAEFLGVVGRDVSVLPHVQVVLLCRLHSLHVGIDLKIANVVNS